MEGWGGREGVAFPTPTPAVHLGKGEEGEGGREKVSLNRYPYQNAICQPRTPAWGGGGGGRWRGDEVGGKPTNRRWAVKAAGSAHRKARTGENHSKILKK